MLTAMRAQPDRVRSADNDIFNYLETGAGNVRAKAGSAASLPELGQGPSRGSDYSDSPEQVGRW